MKDKIAAVVAAIATTKHTVWCHPSQLETVRAAMSELDVEVKSSSLITQPDTLWAGKDSLYPLRPH